MMVEVSLGDVGRAYMQGVLRQCTGVASRLVEIVSSPGKIFAPLPLGTTEERAQQFEVGGLSSRGDALNWLFNDLTRKQDGMFILQDIWLQASDIELRRPTVESYVTDGSRVYYYLPSSLFSPDKLTKLHKQISSFQTVGFYVAGGINLTFEQRRQHRISDGYIDQFVPLTAAVYISAYDQESWIVWRTAAK